MSGWRRIPVVLLALAAAGVVPVLALEPAVRTERPVAAVAEAPASDLDRVEQYLNDIKSLQASFIQEAPDGTVTEGTLSLERPGKLRFAYQPEVPLLVVSDGSTLTFIDYDLKQVTRWPIGETPLGFLVAKTVNLRDKLQVTTTHGADGLIRVKVVDPARADQGFITLIFEDKPLALRAWEAIDAQGLKTRVTIMNPVYNTKLAASLFTYKDPRALPFSGKKGPR